MEIISSLNNFSLTCYALPLALLLACLLDMVLGDPRWLLHPVVIVAMVCSFYEKLFSACSPYPLVAGFLTNLGTIITTLLFSFLFLYLFSLISPFALFLGSVFLLYTTLALRGLYEHVWAVYQALLDSPADLSRARKKLAMIVGRETDKLDKTSIIRACVETVAENMSDGIIAPWFYGSVFALVALFFCPEFSFPAAAVGAMLYKAVNTMDSMFGYKNDKYLYFGRFSARLDDVANWLPARISALLVVLAAYISDHNYRLAWKVMLRDHNKHASPNAGWPESAMAGALAVQLGGASCYFSQIIEKPTIGDNHNSLEVEHIKSSLQVMIVGSVLAYLLVVCCLFLFCLGAFAV